MQKKLWSEKLCIYSLLGGCAKQQERLWENAHWNPGAQDEKDSGGPEGWKQSITNILVRPWIPIERREQ